MVVRGQPGTYQDDEEHCASELVDDKIDQVSKPVAKSCFNQQMETENKYKEDN